MNEDEAAALYAAALALSQREAKAMVVRGMRDLATIRRDAVREVEALPPDGPVDLVFLALLDAILQRLTARMSREIGNVVENGVRSAVATTFSEMSDATLTALTGAGLDTSGAANRLDNAEQAALALALLGTTEEPPASVVARRVREILGRLRAWVSVVGQTLGSRRELIRAVTQSLKGLPVAQEIRTLAGRLFRGDTLPVATDRILLAETWAGVLLSEQMAANASGLIQLGLWQLSQFHPAPDICDDLAAYDSGYGPGWYPIADFPRLPHPRCACVMGAVRVRPVEAWRR